MMPGHFPQPFQRSHDLNGHLWIAQSSLPGGGDSTVGYQVPTVRFMAPDSGGSGAESRGMEPSRAICGACKSKLKDLPVHVSSARSTIFNSGCLRLWCVCALKCTCVVFFFRYKQCAHDACVDCRSRGTLRMVDSAFLFIHN